MCCLYQVKQSVPQTRFDGVCDELANALQREEQAQQLLKKQSEQLEQLNLQLDAQRTDEAGRDATVEEAIKVERPDWEGGGGGKRKAFQAG